MPEKCQKNWRTNPVGNALLPLNQTKMFNWNKCHNQSFTDLSVVTQDEEQVRCPDYTVFGRVIITTVRKASVVTEDIEDVSGGDEAVTIHVTRTGRVVIRLMKTLREKLTRDAYRARKRLADRAVEVNAAIRAGMEAGGDSVA